MAIWNARRYSSGMGSTFDILFLSQICNLRHRMLLVDDRVITTLRALSR